MGQSGSKTHLGHFGVASHLFSHRLARAGTPSLFQELISDTLETIFILDGFLYHQRGKLSNITVKR